jgi:hypothetical protein
MYAHIRRKPFFKRGRIPWIWPATFLIRHVLTQQEMSACPSVPMPVSFVHASNMLDESMAAPGPGLAKTAEKRLHMHAGWC